MAKVRLVLAFFVAVAMFGGIVRPAAPVLAADPDAVGFVAGQWRVVTHAVSVVESDSALGLAAGDPNWVVAVVDVTNVGTSVAPIALADLEVSVDNAPLSFSAASTKAAHAKLKLTAPDASGSINVAEDETQRFALIYEGGADLAAEDTVIGMGTERVALELVASEKIAVADLPETPTWSVTQTVFDRGAVDAVQIPPADDCYGAEAEAEIQRLTGGTIWTGPEGDLTWYWDAAQGHLVPLQASLVEGGFAGALTGSSHVFSPWLTAKMDAAQEDDAGLWDLCKDAKGTWINPPTPGPPTAEELRADYQWIDVRDLLIRPDSFTGEKIAISGEVFNIFVDGDITAMQIWVDGGNYDAVMVAYEGDSRGIYEGTWVTIYGVGAGTISGTNSFGGSVTQPLVLAEIVDF